MMIDLKTQTLNVKNKAKSKPEIEDRTRICRSNQNMNN